MATTSNDAGYDANQKNAELRTCATCQREFYVTHPDRVPVPFVCAGCRK